LHLDGGALALAGSSTPEQRRYKDPMIGMIYAVSPEGVIGLDGKIPWRHPGDLRRFRRVTMGAAVIMGRTTFESMGKPLSGRRNLVVSSRPLEVPGVERVSTVSEALTLAGKGDVWFIGGARIYDEAMRYVDVIDVTYVPDHVPTAGAVHAPAIDLQLFEPGPLLAHEDEPSLSRRAYTRRARVGYGTVG
jgi:dihydrofolate reductase